MDTSSFFNYPTLQGSTERGGELSLLPDTTEEDWARLFGYTETVRFGVGDVVMAEGERDRALYLLTDGELEASLPGGGGGVRRKRIEAPAVVGEVGFFDGLPRSGTLRGLTEGEVLRLSYDSFEALAARDARLAREFLLDLGRIVSSRLRAASGSFPE